MCSIHLGVRSRQQQSAPRQMGVRRRDVVGGRVWAQVQDVGGIIERLLGFLEVGKPFVTAEAVTQIADLLRRFPDLAEVCISSVSLITPQVLSPPLTRCEFECAAHSLDCFLVIDSVVRGPPQPRLFPFVGVCRSTAMQGLGAALYCSDSGLATALYRSDPGPATAMYHTNGKLRSGRVGDPGC